MRRLAFAAVLLALGLSVSPTWASRSPSRPATALTSFRLQVVGPQDRSATYWVAFGPLAGRFGLVQLHESSPGVYVATRRLPTNQKGIFDFLSGRGDIHTRAGLAPGSPIIRIRQVGPTTIWPRGVPTVRWRAPAG